MVNVIALAPTFSDVLFGLSMWVLAACIPSGIAQLKGRNSVPFFLYGLLFAPLAIAHATLMRNRRIDETTEQLKALAALLRPNGQVQTPAAAAVRPLHAGVTVEPVNGRKVQMTVAAFIDQARALGLDAGERVGRPYRVLSDGEIESLRADGGIDVFDSWAAFDRNSPIRTKRV